MKLDEFGVGKITAQNTTKDVKPGETERQAKKLGLGGKPKLLHKTAAKNSDPNTLMNLGISESVEGITDPLVAEFLQSTGQTFSKRDTCGPACIDFISWARREKGIELKRVRGEFVADQVVHAKADFTPEMKQEFAQSGLDWNSAKDRKAWIEQSKYAEEWRRVPHYWTVDKDGNIHDPSGYQQIVKTGLASDLDPSRYIPEGVNEAEEVVPMLYHATYKPFLDSIMKNGLGGKGAQTQWEDSKPGYVYLAKDPEVAYSHAEANEEVPDEYIDNIVVLSIDASQLDQDNLEDDPNVMDDDSTLAYKGIIPTSAFSVNESLQELKIEKPDPKDTLGVKRKDMPQVKSDDYAEFIAYLKKNGATFTKETIPARELKAMQKEFSDEGILKQMMKNIEQGPNRKAVIASSDDYILDGHHRWLVAVNTGADLNVFRVNLPAYKLYDLVNKFEKTYYKDIYSERVSIGVPFASGLVMKLFPHRPLKIAKSTPGKLNYNEVSQSQDSLGSQINFPGFEKNKEKPKPKYNPVPKKDKSVLDKVKGWFTDDINEAYVLRLENDDDMLVLHIRDTKSGERVEVRGKPNYEIDYDENDELHQLLDIIGKASNISELMNGKIVNINPKHPDGPKSYAAIEKVMGEEWSAKYKRSINCDNPKGFSQKAHCAGRKKNEGAEITMWTNPEYQGSDVDDEYYNKQPAKIIDISKLTPFEPADKMDDPISATNMGKLVKAIQAGEKINPVIVVPYEGKLLIVDGHHRYFAHIKAGADKIPVVMADPKDLTWRDDVPVEEQESIRESYEIEFVCVNPNFCDATEQKNQDRLFQALRAVPGIIVYKQDFDEHNSMAAIVKDEADTDAPKLIQKIAQQHKVAIDLENDVSQSMMDDIITGRLEGLTDYYDTDSLSEAKVEEGVNDPHIFKAVFLAGGPGSGKSFVARNILGGTGLKTMNSDDVYEILMKKQDLALDPDTIASPQGQEIRDKAKLMTKKRSANWIDGRLGLLIDGTGKDVAKYQKQAEFLRMLGYDVAMIFVNTSEEVAQQRNRQRARSLKPEMVSAMWNDVQQNLMKFQQIFGAGRFHIIDNSGGLEDLDRQKNFDKVYNETQRFLNTPPSKPAAKKWIQNQKAQNDATQRSERTTTNNTDSDGGVGTTN